MLRPSPYFVSPPPITPQWAISTPGAELAVELDDVKTFLNRPLEDTFWDLASRYYGEGAAWRIEPC